MRFLGGYPSERLIFYEVLLLPEGTKPRWNRLVNILMQNPTRIKNKKICCSNKRGD